MDSVASCFFSFYSNPVRTNFPNLSLSITATILWFSMFQFPLGVTVAGQFSNDFAIKNEIAVISFIAYMALMAWFKEAEKAFWKSPSDIKKQYRSASIIADNRVVFNICGNKYRLVVKINYGYGMVYIRFIGTHQQYDKVNVEEV